MVFNCLFCLVTEGMPFPLWLQFCSNDCLGVLGGFQCETIVHLLNKLQFLSIITLYGVFTRYFTGGNILDPYFRLESGDDVIMPSCHVLSGICVVFFQYNCVDS